MTSREGFASMMLLAERLFPDNGLEMGFLDFIPQRALTDTFQAQFCVEPKSGAKSRFISAELNTVTDFAPPCMPVRGWTKSRIRGLPDGSVRITKVGMWRSVGARVCPP